MLINRDTKLYGSFSINPGNNGTKFFNEKFSELGIDAIYKSYKIDDISKAVDAALTLGFSGFAVSMPYKFEIVQYCDYLNPLAKQIKAVNTVLIKQGKLYGYNTDYLGVQKFLHGEQLNGLAIIGNGGFSKAVQHYCVTSEIDCEVYTRKNIKLLSNTEYKIFNATPEDFECDFDGRPHTPQGKLIARYQAEEQLKLYVS
jgi:shikimate dehydrogenase